MYPYLFSQRREPAGIPAAHAVFLAEMPSVRAVYDGESVPRRGGETVVGAVARGEAAAAVRAHALRRHVHHIAGAHMAAAREAAARKEVKEKERYAEKMRMERKAARSKK